MIILKEIKISENVFNALSMRASANALTIEEQIEHDLAERFHGEKNNPDEQHLIEEVERERNLLAARGIVLTDEFLSEAKAWERR